MSPHPDVRRHGATVGVILLAGALLSGAVTLEAARERRYPAPSVDEEWLYLRSGDALRHLTVAYNALAADVYWIRAIQYYGGMHRRLDRLPAGLGPQPHDRSDDYALLYPLLDITTTLDPRFNIAYRFGAIFLAEPYPGGAGRPDLAVALLEKGMRARPDKWEYMQDAGFVYYWYLHDYRTAAAWFKKAGDVPNAPWWLRSLAATTLARGGDRQASRAMWEAIRQSAEIDWLRNDAERRLTQLTALDQIDGLQRTVDEYARRAGAPPADWGTLVRARLLPGLPLDPTHTPYTLTPDGRVELSQSSPLWPPPDEPPGGASKPPA